MIRALHPIITPKSIRLDEFSTGPTVGGPNAAQRGHREMRYLMIPALLPVGAFAGAAPDDGDAL